MDGTHLQIGIDLLRKYGETEEVVHAMACHHGDYDPQTVEAVLVTAADALSAARPGARREILETYVKRLEKLEEIASSFKGVQKTFAIQAGREIRIIVDSGKISDEQALWLSKDIARKIEQELHLPRPDQGDGDPRDPVGRVRPVEERAMKLLFVGDVIGKPGRRALQHLLPRLVDQPPGRLRGGQRRELGRRLRRHAGGAARRSRTCRSTSTRPATTSGTRRRGRDSSTASPASCAPPTTRRATPARGSTWGRRRRASRWR